LPVPDALAQVDSGECVDLLPVRAGDRLLDRGLETVREIQDDVGLLELADVPWRELDVVRLRAGRSQVLDVDLLPAELLGNKRKRVESRDDRPAASTARRAATSAQQDHGSHKHGNDSHQGKR